VAFIRSSLFFLVPNFGIIAEACTIVWVGVIVSSSGQKVVMRERWDDYRVGFSNVICYVSINSLLSNLLSNFSSSFLSDFLKYRICQHPQPLY